MGKTPPKQALGEYVPGSQKFVNDLKENVDEESVPEQKLLLEQQRLEEIIESADDESRSRYEALRGKCVNLRETISRLRKKNKKGIKLTEKTQRIFSDFSVFMSDMEKIKTGLEAADAATRAVESEARPDDAEPEPPIVEPVITAAPEPVAEPTPDVVVPPVAVAPVSNVDVVVAPAPVLPEPEPVPEPPPSAPDTEPVLESEPPDMGSEPALPIAEDTNMDIVTPAEEEPFVKLELERKLEVARQAMVEVLLEKEKASGVVAKGINKVFGAKDKMAKLEEKFNLAWEKYKTAQDRLVQLSEQDFNTVMQVLEKEKSRFNEVVGKASKGKEWWISKIWRQLGDLNIYNLMEKNLEEVRAKQAERAREGGGAEGEQKKVSNRGLSRESLAHQWEQARTGLIGKAGKVLSVRTAISVGLGVGAVYDVGAALATKVVWGAAAGTFGGRQAIDGVTSSVAERLGGRKKIYENQDELRADLEKSNWFSRGLESLRNRINLEGKDKPEKIKILSETIENYHAWAAVNGVDLDKNEAYNKLLSLRENILARYLEEQMERSEPIEVNDKKAEILNKFLDGRKEELDRLGEKITSEKRKRWAARIGSVAIGGAVASWAYLRAASNYGKELMNKAHHFGADQTNVDDAKSQTAAISSAEKNLSAPAPMETPKVMPVIDGLKLKEAGTFADGAEVDARGPSTAAHKLEAWFKAHGVAKWTGGDITEELKRQGYKFIYNKEGQLLEERHPVVFKAGGHARLVPWVDADGHGHWKIVDPDSKGVRDLNGGAWVRTLRETGAPELKPQAPPVKIDMPEAPPVKGGGEIGRYFDPINKDLAVETDSARGEQITVRFGVVDPAGETDKMEFKGYSKSSLPDSLGDRPLDQVDSDTYKLAPEAFIPPEKPFGEALRGLQQETRTLDDLDTAYQILAEHGLANTPEAHALGGNIHDLMQGMAGKYVVPPEELFTENMLDRYYPDFVHEEAPEITAVADKPASGGILSSVHIERAVENAGGGGSKIISTGEEWQKITESARGGGGAVSAVEKPIPTPPAPLVVDESWMDQEKELPVSSMPTEMGLEEAGTALARIKGLEIFSRSLLEVITSANHSSIVVDSRGMQEIILRKIFDNVSSVAKTHPELLPEMNKIDFAKDPAELKGLVEQFGLTPEERLFFGDLDSGDIEDIAPPPKGVGEIFVTKTPSHILRGVWPDADSKRFVISSNKYLFGEAPAGPHKGGLEITREGDGTKLYPTSIEANASGYPIIHYENAAGVEKTITIASKANS